MSKTRPSTMKSFPQVLNVENTAGCAQDAVDSLFRLDQRLLK